MDSDNFFQHQLNYTKKLMDKLTHMFQFGCKYNKSCGSDCILGELQELLDMGDDIKKSFEFIECASYIQCEIDAERCTGEHDCEPTKFIKKTNNQSLVHAQKVKEYEERTGKKYEGFVWKK